MRAFLILVVVVLVGIYATCDFASTRLFRPEWSTDHPMGQ